MAIDKKKVLNEIRIFLLMILIVSSLRSALADWNDVPTGSMKPTIQEGDRVVVNKLAYDLKVPFTTIKVIGWDDPKRGDIVVLFSPVDGTRLVKRVVALPERSGGDAREPALHQRPDGQAVACGYD